MKCAAVLLLCLAAAAVAQATSDNSSTKAVTEVPAMVSNPISCTISYVVEIGENIESIVALVLSIADHAVEFAWDFLKCGLSLSCMKKDFDHMYAADIIAIEDIIDECGSIVANAMSIAGCYI